MPTPPLISAIGPLVQEKIAVRDVDHDLVSFADHVVEVIRDLATWLALDADPIAPRV